MERPKYFIIFFICIGFQSLQASFNIDIYNAFIKNNMQGWKRIIDEMHARENKSNEFILELLNYEYGYIGWCLGNEQREQAKIYLERGERNIEKLEKSGYKMSYVNAYKSAFYGFKIGMNKIQAPVMGPSSYDCAKQAISLDANNPYGYIQYGNVQYFMPRIFGGSKTVALEYYEKAQKLMELQGERIKYDWNYLNLLVTIAKAYQEKGQKKTAKTIYEKILQIEPSFTWVKNELYPELLKEMN